MNRHHGRHDDPHRDPYHDPHLEARLHALAAAVRTPVTPLEHDLRRGRRRLLQVRLGVAGASTATLAIVLGFTGLTAGNPTATEISPVTRPTGTDLPNSPSPSPSQSPAEDPAGADAGGEDAADPQGGRSDEQGGSGAASATSDEAIGSQTGRSETGPRAGTTHTDGSEHAVDPGVPDGQSDPTTGPTPSSQPTSDPSSQPTGDPSVDPTTDPTSDPSGPPTSPPPSDPPPSTGVTAAQVTASLRSWNAALARTLDPTREHLARYPVSAGSTQVRSDDDELFSLATTYSWTGDHGRSGLGVQVASGWDQVDWDCGDTRADWVCQSADVSDLGGARYADLVDAEVATHDGVREVAVEHEDGQVVVLTALPTLQGRTVVADGVAAVGVTQSALVHAAASARLLLPGDPPVAPPTLDLADFAAEGVAALVPASATGEVLEVVSRDRSPRVRGVWEVDGRSRGTVSWWAAPVYSGAQWQCQDSYRVCFDLTVGGKTMHLARPTATSGWLIGYDGPSYATRVYVADRTFPRKRAYAFLTDPAWQPVR